VAGIPDRERVAEAAMRGLAHDVHNVDLRRQLSMAGWHTPLQSAGFVACDNLALDPHIPSDTRVEARGHLVYYVEPLAGGEFCPLETRAASTRSLTAAEDETRHDRWSAASLATDHWFASAPPIAWPGAADRTVEIVREVVMLKRAVDQWARVHLHRWVEYEHDHMTRVSRPFIFLHRGVELISTLAGSDDAAAVVVTFSVEDDRAYACRLPVARLDELLSARVLPSAE
jgi:hypothetical protein